MLMPPSCTPTALPATLTTAPMASPADFSSYSPGIGVSAVLGQSMVDGMAPLLQKLVNKIIKLEFADLLAAGGDRHGSTAAAPERSSNGHSAMGIYNVLQHWWVRCHNLTQPRCQN